MLNGLYKVEYGVNDAFGRSIMCMHNGKLLGGPLAGKRSLRLAATLKLMRPA